MQSGPDDFRLIVCGVRTNIRSGQNDEHRNAIRVCDRLRGHHHHAEDESECAAAIQNAACAPDTHSWRSGLPCDDAWPGMDELAAAGGVARGRDDNLFWVQPVTKRAEFVGERD